MPYSNTIHDKMTKINDCSKHVNEHCLCLKSIIIGAFIAIGLSFLFNIFNIGLGLSAYSSQAEKISLAIGGFLWLVIGSFITMFIVGAVTSLVSQTPCKIMGILHGFSAWCLSLILLLIITLWALSLTSDHAPLIISQPFTSLLTHSLGSWNNPPVNYTSGGILAFFFVFLVGALASCIGGYMGAKKNTYKPTQDMNH